MWRRWWWFQEKGPVIPGPELGWFYGTQCLLGSTEDITDDFDILKFNLRYFNPFEKGYFLNNWPTNSIYGICNLFSQELLEVFLHNSFVEIRKKKYTQCIWVVLICFVSSQTLHSTKLFYWVVWPCGSAKAVGRQLWMELVGLCRCWY